MIEERVSHIDFLPTLFTMLNFDFSEEDFFGKPMKTNGRFFFYTQSHKYLIGMIKGDLKIIIDLNRNLVEIYDLKEDATEKFSRAYTKQYDSEILELLMWHYCQLNYFSPEEPDRELEGYCEPFRD